MLLDLYSESHHLLVVQLNDYPHYAGVVWPSYSDLALCEGSLLLCACFYPQHSRWERDGAEGFSP